MNARVVPRGNHGVEPRFRAARQRKCRRARAGVDDADVLHEHPSPEAGADGFGKCFFGRKPLRESPRARERALGCLGAFGLREHTGFEPVAEPVERGLNALDIAEV